MSKRRRLIIIAGGVLGLLLLVVATVWLIRRDSSPAPIPFPEIGPILRGENTAAEEIVTEVAYLPYFGAVEVGFLEPMNPQRTNGAFGLVAQNGIKAQGEISWHEDNTVLLFKPKHPLNPASTYNIQIAPGTMTRDGTLSLGVSASFVAPADAGEHIAVSIRPKRGSLDVSRLEPIGISFLRPAALSDAEAMPEEVLQIEPPLSGQGSWDGRANYHFVPDEPLKSDTMYTIRLNAALASALSSEPLDEDITWQFRTAAPRFIDVLRIGGGVGEISKAQVPVTSTLAVEFSQAMDPASVAQKLALRAVAYGDPMVGAPLPVNLVWQAGNTIVSVTPEEPLNPATNYELLLEGGARSADGGACQQSGFWPFTTESSVFVIETRPSESARFSDNFILLFDRQLDPGSLEGNVIIDPPPNVTGRPYDYIDDDRKLVIYGLEPGVSYHISLLSGVADVAGRQLGATQMFQWNNGDRYPSAHIMLWQEPAIFQPGAKQEFYIELVNVVGQINFDLYSLSPEAFVNKDPLNKDRQREGGFWVKAEGGLNEVSRQLVQMSNGNISPGLYYLESKVSDATGLRHFDNRFFMVTNSNLMLKVGEGEALAWLTGIDSGAPISDTTIRLFQKGNSRAVGEGMTDNEGLARILIPDSLYTIGTAPTLADFYAVTDLPVGHENYAFTSSEWPSGNKDIDSLIEDRPAWKPDELTGYVYTDRPVYRPGQKVYFKGIMRYENDLSYWHEDERDLSVRVTLQYDGVTRETLDLLVAKEHGTFQGEFTIDEAYSPGEYEINTVAQNGQSLPTVNLSVADYERQEFEVELEPSATDIVAGKPFSATVKTGYFAGGPVIGAKVEARLTERAETFRPDSAIWNSFSFEEVDIGGVPLAGSPGLAKLGTVTTGEDGFAIVEVPPLPHDPRRVKLVSLETAVTDRGGGTVPAGTLIRIHPSRYYVGLRQAEKVVNAYTEQIVDLAVLDWTGQPVADQPVTVEVFREVWNRVDRQVPGAILPVYSRESTALQDAKTIVTKPDGREIARFTPDGAAAYLVKATTTDELGNVSTAAVRYDVSAPGEYLALPYDAYERVTIVQDRDVYQAGDVARILLSSPYQGPAHALLTVERGSILFADVIPLANNSQVYALMIKPEMAPGAYISVLIVKGRDGPGELPGFAIGMEPLNVDKSVRHLNIEVTSRTPSPLPGQEVTLTLKTTNSDGNPVAAELSIAVVDLAIVSQMEPNTGPILDFFYGDASLGVKTSMPMVMLAELINHLLEEGSPIGAAMGSGSKGIAGGVLEIRGKFQDTAFWEAQVVSDVNGEAQLRLTLPDNVTTWRLDVRGVTPDTLVGQMTYDMRSTKPLIIIPQTPRFFVGGDRPVVSALVQNNSDGEMAVMASLDGQGFSLLPEGQKSRQLALASGETQHVTWSVTIDTMADDVEMMFRAVSEPHSDVALPYAAGDDGRLPVYRYQPSRASAMAGIMTEEDEQPHDLPDLSGYQQVSLEVTIRHSLIGALESALEYLCEQGVETTEATASQILPAIHLNRASEELLGRPLSGDCARSVDSKLNQLIEMRNNASKGWGMFDDQASQQVTTAYALLALQAAYERDTYPAVLEEIIPAESLYLSSLRQALPSFVREQLNRQAFVLYVLSQTDPNMVRQEDIWRLYEERENMSLYGQALLALALKAVDDHNDKEDVLPPDPRLAVMSQALADEAQPQGTSWYWRERVGDEANWNSDLRTTAIVLLALLSLDPHNDVNLGAVEWLMSNQVEDHWHGSQQTSWAIMALSEWARLIGDSAPESLPDYTYRISMNGHFREGPDTTSDGPSVPEVVHILLPESSDQQDSAFSVSRSSGPGTMLYSARVEGHRPVDDNLAGTGPIILNRQYFVKRDYSPEGPIPMPMSGVTPGQYVIARLEIEAPDDLHFLRIVDPLPAGFEAMLIEPESELLAGTFSDCGEDHERYFDRALAGDESVTLTAEILPRGSYCYVYLARAATPGEYQVLPPTAHQLYGARWFGNGPGMEVRVGPPDTVALH